MALRKPKTPEEIAAKEARQRKAQQDKALKAFLTSPAGRARGSFENGDRVFQYVIDVMSQSAVVVAMIGSTTTKTAIDPSDVLNSVCDEGWELVNGDFVF